MKNRREEVEEEHLEAAERGAPIGPRRFQSGGDSQPVAPEILSAECAQYPEPSFRLAAVHDWRADDTRFQRPV